MNSRAALLIGGMGFVGRRLRERLAGSGCKVHVMDKRIPQNQKNGETTFYECDLTDASVLREVLPRCDTVFFLASDSVPATTAGSSLREGKLNLIPFLSFLEIFQNYPNSHLIYLSSGGTIYGNPDSVPAAETSPAAPISYHGAGKAAIEAFLHACASQNRRPITVIRPSNLYGPHQTYVPVFGVVRSILEKLKRDQTVDIWGDGEVVRDYLYIDDFVEALLMCMRSARNAGGYRVFNVSSGCSLSINQLCEAIEAATKKKINRVYLPGRAIDVRAVVLDNSKIQKELGWRPLVGIEEGIRRTWEWLQKLDD